MADKTFTLQIISPTRIFFDEEVDMVEMRTTEGEIDVHRAEEAKHRAERRIGSGEKQVDMVRAELALKKALTRINLVSTLGK